MFADKEENAPAFVPFVGQFRPKVLKGPIPPLALSLHRPPNGTGPAQRISEEFQPMPNPDAFYRVKVLVDGAWVSAGDFRDLDQAKTRALFITWHVERAVEVRDAFGRLIHREEPVLAGAEQLTVLLDGFARNTVALD
jgi:hypothetical protein